MLRWHRMLGPRVWLAWGRWWAVQFWPSLYFSLGVHVDPRRPIIDLHLGWLIVSVGNEAHITGQSDRHRQSCRGFLFADDPVL